jgi:signal transduction histidine kinase/anti-sigma regulatory factor (Ser/Thr protein kinase)
VAGQNQEIAQAFRPRSRLLQLLGDQLIGSAKLAVFELVKNAYDADASHVRVILRRLRSPSPEITVIDDGEGMSLATIRDVWLVPGDDHREKERAAQKRSPKFGRLPLGEKGVGRFAVHKLGDQITLVTRAAGEMECVVKINWPELLQHEFLDRAFVTVREREPKIFADDKTGTVINISSLRETSWTRRDVRDLYRQLTSIASPFGKYSSDFNVRVEVPDEPTYLNDLPDTSELVRSAPWHFTFSFDGTTFQYTYEFRGVPGISARPRIVERPEFPLQVLPRLEPDDLDPSGGAKRKRPKKITADSAMLRGVGPIKGEFYVFDRDREVLSKLAGSRFVERFLDQNGGVRVYRDGIRVYNYGEPGDDWLGLDLRRVNIPTKNISRNIILGAIELDLGQSSSLREKTNREGFVESAAFDRFRQIVLGALGVLESERSIDKQKIRAATGKSLQPAKDLSGPLAELRNIATQHHVDRQMEPAFAKIERDYNDLRDNFLRAGLSQVGLATVFHEVERGVAVLHRSIAANAPLRELEVQAGQLQSVLETSTQLLKRGSKKENSLRDLVRRAYDLSLVRFRLHEVELTCPAIEEVSPDATSLFVFNLALGALANLIDNSIHWLDVAFPDGTSRSGSRKMFINLIPDFYIGPAVVVADNGPGFVDEPEQLVLPFFSRRPEGMGLGLYYANLVMQLNEGELIFPDRSDVGVPPGYTGAVVALAFRKAR